MVESAFTAPHVTEFITLDMTPTMELRPKVQALPEFRDVKVTPLLFVAKALLLAVSRNPEINATWDEAAQEIVVKDYVNLGIAAATPRGLLVPNLKDADSLSLPELARALQDLTETARAGKTSPADMAGGTITITNVGTFGVDNGTPIINPGESAILCFGAVRPTPWVVDGAIVAAAGHAAVAVLRPPQRRRGAGLAVPGRRGPGAVRPVDGARLGLSRSGGRRQVIHSVEMTVPSAGGRISSRRSRRRISIFSTRIAGDRTAPRRSISCRRRSVPSSSGVSRASVACMGSALRPERGADRRADRVLLVRATRVIQ